MVSVTLWGSHVALTNVLARYLPSCLCYGEDASGCLRFSGDEEVEEEFGHSFLMRASQNFSKVALCSQPSHTVVGGMMFKGHVFKGGRGWERTRDCWDQGFPVLQQLFNTPVSSWGSSEERRFEGLLTPGPGFCWVGLGYMKVLEVRLPTFESKLRNFLPL